MWQKLWEQAHLFPRKIKRSSKSIPLFKRNRVIKLTLSHWKTLFKDYRQRTLSSQANLKWMIRASTAQKSIVYTSLDQTKFCFQVMDNSKSLQDFQRTLASFLMIPLALILATKSRDFWMKWFFSFHKLMSALFVASLILQIWKRRVSFRISCLDLKLHTIEMQFRSHFSRHYFQSKSWFVMPLHNTKIWSKWLGL